jgi:hypothetical protein
VSEERTGRVALLWRGSREAREKAASQGNRLSPINLESDWIPAMQQLLDLPTERLPAIWDADFLYGPKTESGDDTYVLCEINVSAVFPFPDQAIAKLAQATATAIADARDARARATGRM